MKDNYLRALWSWGSGLRLKRPNVSLKSASYRLAYVRLRCSLADEDTLKNHQEKLNSNLKKNLETRAERRGAGHWSFRKKATECPSEGRALPPAPRRPLPASSVEAGAGGQPGSRAHPVADPLSGERAALPGVATSPGPTQASVLLLSGCEGEDQARRRTRGRVGAFARGNGLSSLPSWRSRTSAPEFRTPLLFLS